MTNKVSVVIPTYNRKEKLKRALDSVFSQTDLNLIGEIIIVDDGSTDGTDIFIKKYTCSHSLIPIKVFSQKNSGPSVARNVGMEKASFDFIAFLDSDDYWVPQKIENQLKIFAQFPDAGLVGSNWTDKPLKILFKKIKKVSKLNKTELLLKFVPVTPSIIIKRKIFEDIGGFDVNIKYYEDCEYFSRICFEGYGYYLCPDKLVVLDDKKPFGDSGLSQNLEMIYKDSAKSLRKFKKMKYINWTQFIVLRFFYFLKHIRRVIVSKL